MGMGKRELTIALKKAISAAVYSVPIWASSSPFWLTCTPCYACDWTSNLGPIWQLTSAYISLPVISSKLDRNWMSSLFSRLLRSMTNVSHASLLLE